LTFEAVTQETPYFRRQHKEATQTHNNVLDHGCRKIIGGTRERQM